MRTRALLALPALAGALVLSASSASAQTDSERSTYVVQLAPSSAPVSALVSSLVARYGGTVGFTYTHAIRGFSVTLPSAVASRLAHDPLVAAVEPVVAMAVNDVQTPAQYDLDRTDQRSGLDNKYTYAASGAGVTAYDLDTGIRPTHVDFGGRASVGYDAIGDGQNGIDCNGHGTHTAGSIASTTYGMAKLAKVVAVRVLGCDGSGTSDQIVAGLDWVTAHAVKPAVANMSIGTTAGTSAVIDAAVRGLVNSGVPIAVSAGNGVGNGLYAEDACTHSPSDEPLALTVSAVDNTDTKPIWANRGTCVDIFAGGVDVNSTWYTSDTATNLDTGTSMSSPHVAGAAAQYLSSNPTATPAQVASFLVGQATTGAVKSPGSGSPNKLLYIGGITGGGGTPGNVAPTASFTSSVSGATATLTDTSTDSDGTIASRAWSFGDGTTGSGTPVSHTYAASGTYTVTLTVTDNGGATASKTGTVTVTVAGGGDPDPSTPNLTSGVAKSDTTGAKGSFKYYKIAVTAGKTVTLTTTGPSCGLLSCPADIDLYGRNGAKPTTTTYTCSAATGSSAETCTITNAPAGYVYVGVYVYSGSAGQAYTVKATIS